MDYEVLKVLLFEDNPRDARLTKEMQLEIEEPGFKALIPRKVTNHGG